MTDRTSFDSVIVGSGPAGLSAALAAAESGASVILFERLHTFGLKLLASGGGKCNVSNRLEIPEFMAAFGREGRFMKPALDNAYHDWLFDFLKRSGVPLKLENGFHYFPCSERARDVFDAFANRFRSLGGVLRNDTQITKLVINDGHISCVKSADGKMTECRSVILAGGGKAWPKLGGTAASLQLAEAAGHTVSKPYPAMAPLLIRNGWVGKLTGISLPDAELSFRRGRQIFRNRGELLFTHDGVSGPCALDLAGDLAETCDRENGETELIFRPDAAKDAIFWKREIEALRKADGRKQINTLLGRFFPRALADAFCMQANCGETRGCELSAGQRDALCSLLGGIPLTARGSGPMEKAMAMKGGIRLKEINPATLESRIVRGLFFAGEIMDLTGPCGGYNIQWALSSGRLAGMSAAGKQP